MSKAKARKEKHQQETAARNERMVKLREAMKNCDHLADLPLFRHFNRNAIEAANRFYCGCPDNYREWVFDLTERNMRGMYERVWGWNAAKKKRELFDCDNRYCIVSVGERPIGFVNLKFEIDDGALQIYVLEFQIEREFQKHGLGRFMMQSVEFIALKRGFERVMLTVFTINTGAMSFYNKMKYVLSPCSPSIVAPGDPDINYEILYKSLVKK